MSTLHLNDAHVIRCGDVVSLIVEFLCVNRVTQFFHHFSFSFVKSVQTYVFFPKTFQATQTYRVTTRYAALLHVKVLVHYLRFREHTHMYVITLMTVQCSPPHPAVGFVRGKSAL